MPDSDISHSVEARLRRIEEHVGLPAPGEEEAEEGAETTDVVEDPEDE